MRVECAWCGEVMSGLKDPPPVSYGICSACLLEQGMWQDDELVVPRLPQRSGEVIDTIWGQMPVGGEG